jgi:hypothetical protein
MGSRGHRVDFDAAHDQATRFNELARLGSVGTVFYACCLLETTTTFAFPIKMLPTRNLCPLRFRQVRLVRGSVFDTGNSYSADCNK